MASDDDIVREVTRQQRIRAFAVSVVAAYGFDAAEAGERAIDIFNAMVAREDVDWDELRELADRSQMRAKYGRLYDEYLHPQTRRRGALACLISAQTSGAGELTPRALAQGIGGAKSPDDVAPHFCLGLEGAEVRTPAAFQLPPHRSLQREWIIVGKRRLDLSLQRWFSCSLHSAG